MNTFTPNTMVDGIRRVAPGLRVSIDDNTSTDQTEMRLRYQSDFITKVDAYSAQQMIEEGIRASVVAVQRKAIEDLGIDTEALRRVKELEDEVNRAVEDSRRAEERAEAAAKRLDDVLALVAKGHAG